MIAPLSITKKDLENIDSLNGIKGFTKRANMILQQESKTAQFDLIRADIEKNQTVKYKQQGIILQDLESMYKEKLSIIEQSKKKEEKVEELFKQLNGAQKEVVEGQIKRQEKIKLNEYKAKGIDITQLTEKDKINIRKKKIIDYCDQQDKKKKNEK